MPLKPEEHEGAAAPEVALGQFLQAAAVAVGPQYQSGTAVGFPELVTVTTEFACLNLSTLLYVR